MVALLIRVSKIKLTHAKRDDKIVSRMIMDTLEVMLYARNSKRYFSHKSV